MLNIDPRTLDTLAGPHRARMRSLLHARLRDAATSGRLDVRRFAIASDAQFETLADDCIERGTAQGIDRVGDMLFFCALTLHDPADVLGCPAGAFVEALLYASDTPAPDRLDGIHDLLPPPLAERLTLDAD